MTFDLAFRFINTVIAIPWILLIFKPRLAWTHKIINFYLLCICLAYTVLILRHFPEMMQNLNSLSQMLVFFQQEPVLLAGWIHFLAFDLITARWICKDAERQGLRHLSITPCLLMTCLAGPIGLLMYFIYRAVHLHLKKRSTT